MKLFSTYDDSTDVRRFREGDTVRSSDNEGNSVVIGVWRDWLWLDPTDYQDAAPFTGRACDYELVGRSY